MSSSLENLVLAILRSKTLTVTLLVLSRYKRELESEDSGDESYSESSESEYQQEDTPALVAPPAEQGGPPQVVVPPPRTTISRQELAQHNTANDLWTELFGIVYDLTNFVGSHPGGSRVIVNIAGKGGLQAFESFHKRNTLQNFDRYIVGSFEIEQQGTPALAPPALVAPPALAPPAEQGGPQVSYSESYSESSESEDQQDTPALAPPAEQGGPQVVAPPPAATTTISRQELAQHNTADGDLWTELFGIVYDLTNFVGSHPGGSRVIVNIAGKGGLQAFESFHKRNTLQKFDRYIVGPLE
jgi:cytochrome b involved in lipid metabolism